MNKLVIEAKARWTHKANAYSFDVHPLPLLNLLIFLKQLTFGMAKPKMISVRADGDVVFICGPDDSE